MGEISKTDERERLKEKYLKNGIDSLSEREVLELFLFYAVGRENAKDVSRRLLDDFSGSLGIIFGAEIDELCKTEGVSRNAAALIHLVNDVSNAVKRSEVKGIKNLSDTKTAMRYAGSVLGKIPYEKMIVITLNSEGSIINCSEAARGTVNMTTVDFEKIIRFIVRDGAASVIVAHNHPDGNSFPSSADREFTAALSRELNLLGVELNDHIIVGKDGETSMKNDENSRGCFVEQ